MIHNIKGCSTIGTICCTTISGIGVSSRVIVSSTLGASSRTGISSSLVSWELSEGVCCGVTVGSWGSLKTGFSTTKEETSSTIDFFIFRIDGAVVERPYAARPLD